jgi:hypothetical protein
MGGLAQASIKRAMQHKEITIRLLPLPLLLALLLGALPLLFAPSQVTAATCNSSNTSGASSLIVHPPTLSLETVTWELAQRNSPLSSDDARFLVQQSKQSSIDDAFALAVWAAETQDGREAVPGTHNIGNITAAHGVSWADHIFAVYPTWQVGIAAWFRLITQLYVPGGHATDLVTFSLFYVHGLTPQEASPEQRQEVTQGYAHTLTSIITTLKQHETALHGSQAGSNQGNGGNTSSNQTLLSLLPPAENLPPGWAGPGTGPAAASIKVSSCDTTGTNLPPLVQAAIQLGPFLRSTFTTGLFDHWAVGSPAGVYSQDGITWDTDFLASVYQAASGNVLPAYPTAASSWWETPPGQGTDWMRVAAGVGQFPQAGDIAVFFDGAQGKVALIAGVQLPRPGHPGFVLVFQGHAQHVFERWPLQIDGTLQPSWTAPAVLAGYLRLPTQNPS